MELSLYDVIRNLSPDLMCPYYFGPLPVLIKTVNHATLNGCFIMLTSLIKQSGRRNQNYDQVSDLN